MLSLIQWMATGRRYVFAIIYARDRCVLPSYHKTSYSPRRECTNILTVQVSRLLLPPPGPHAVSTPVATFAFDNTQELLWAGNEFGRVTSFYGTELQQYTSFRAGDGPVRQLLLHEKGVIALCSRSIHMATRRGPPIWHIM